MSVKRPPKRPVKPPSSAEVPSTPEQKKNAAQTKIEANPDALVIAQMINHRRRQVLVHSELYYGMDESIVSDQKFDEWAKHLATLQKVHPDIAAEVPFAEEFKDFNGSTGYHLVGKVPWARSKANQILLEHRRRTG